MITIEPPPRKHQCEVPWESGGYGSTGKPDGTLVRCDCGIWWVSRPCYESLGPTSWWVRVRWYHFRLRKRIEQFESGLR